MWFLVIFNLTQNDGPIILTPSPMLGGLPQLIFCLPLRNDGLTANQRYERSI